MEWENKQDDPCILNILVPGNKTRKDVNKDLTMVVALEIFKKEIFLEISIYFPCCLFLSISLIH